MERHATPRDRTETKAPTVVRSRPCLLLGSLDDSACHQHPTNRAMSAIPTLSARMQSAAPEALTGDALRSRERQRRAMLRTRQARSRLSRTRCISQRGSGLSKSLLSPLAPAARLTAQCFRPMLKLGFVPAPRKLPSPTTHYLRPADRSVRESRGRCPSTSVGKKHGQLRLFSNSCPKSARTLTKCLVA